MAKDIYKRLTVIFYEKDKECYEEFNQLAQDQDISMTNLAKKLIYKELEDSKKGWLISPFFFIYKQVTFKISAINLIVSPATIQFIDVHHLFILLLIFLATS